MIDRKHMRKIIIALCLAVALNSAAVLPAFAETEPSTETAPSTETTPSTKALPEEEPKETEKPSTVKPQKKSEVFTITATQNNPEGGVVDGDLGDVPQGEDPTVTIEPSKGYAIEDVIIDGRSVGAKASHTFKPIEEDHTIKVVFKKEKLFVMLDAGHYGLYERSAVYPSYYESNMAWTLHQYLKTELERYNNVAVGVTRAEKAKDLAVYSRGAAAKGCDLFLSMHSGTTSSSNYPLIMVQKGNTSDPLAINLGKTIQTTMGLSHSYKISQKLTADQDTEFYGALRGARAVGVKGMLLQHASHANKTSAVWLSQEDNLKKLARAEAAAIAEYYGLSTDRNDTVMPFVPEDVKVASSNYNALTVKWAPAVGATSYEVFRSTEKTGTYESIAVLRDVMTSSYKDTELDTGKNYYYKIRSYRKMSGKESNTSSAVGAAPKLSAPKASAAAAKGSITLKWNKVSGANGYVVYRATKKSGTYKALKTINSASTVSYKDKSTKKGKTYYYKVKTYRKVSDNPVYSSYSNITYKKAK